MEKRLGLLLFSLLSLIFILIVFFYNYKTVYISEPVKDTDSDTTERFITKIGEEKILKNETAIVSEVIDGDTIRLDSGLYVRLIGINAPEKGEPYYNTAKNRLKTTVEGKTVILEKDKDDKDRYGRLLRYIFLDGKNINVELAKEGLAIVYILEKNIKYETELIQAEKIAKNKRINIWSLSKKLSHRNETCDNRCIRISYFHWNAKGNDCENLNDEYVIFENRCHFSCNLTGWSVRDRSSRHIYKFPAFILSPGAQVVLHTGCGRDTSDTLYWCNTGDTCNAVWSNEGDTLFLRDANGGLILSYSYPEQLANSDS